MKNLILVSICIVIMFSLKTNVNYAQEKDGLLKGYASTEDIIVQIVKPNIGQVLREKYGDELVNWHYENREIVDLKLVQDKSLVPKWFEITVSVEYVLKDKDGSGHIVFKIVPPSSSADKEIQIEYIDSTLWKRVD
jgi:hypothetical protein